MSLYTHVVSGLLFPLHERLKRHDTVAVRRHLETTQWWPRERIETLQLERLRALLEHAAAHVPYYCRRFSELGFEAGDLRSVRDLQRLPFLTKPLIREHAGSLRSDHARALTRSNTGGSTGEPLVFYIGRERVSHDVAAKWRATRWWGVDIGDPEAVIWGAPIELGSQSRLKDLRDRLLRTRLLPAFEMSPENLDRYLERIRGMRPRMLFGYPSAIAHLARHGRDRGIALDDLGVRVAFVTAEKLYEDQSRVIADVFGCRIANGYGGRDAGFIAHECPAGGMHITAEDIVVEVVRPDGSPAASGEAGEIVITHLATRDFPFIRYRTGDVGVLAEEDCSCGRGLPLLREIQGRATDFITTPDGTVMHGLALIYVVREVEGVEQFKIVQESPERVRVLLVPGAAFEEPAAERIRDGIARRMGAGVQVDTERVDRIPPEASGKYRYIVSKVTPGEGTARGVAASGGAT